MAHIRLIFGCSLLRAAGESRSKRAPRPLIVVARHTAKAVAKSTDQRRATAYSVPSSGVGLSPGSTRPNQLRFHPDGSSEAQSELSLVVANLLDLAQTNLQPVILDSLVFALAEPLSPQQPAEAAYGLRHWACKQERFVVAAVALAEQAVNHLPSLDLLGRMLFSLDWLADLGLRLVQLCQIQCNQSCSWIIQVSGSKLLGLEVEDCLTSEVGC